MKNLSKAMKRGWLVILLFGVSLLLFSQPVHADPQSVNVAIIGSPEIIKGGTLPTTGTDLAGITFTNLAPGNVDAGNLTPFDTVVLNVASPQLDCNINLSSAEKAALVAFVDGGKKMIIFDSECTPQNYDWLPFQFTTDNPGAKGSPGTLTIVEENTLSSNDSSSPLFIDAANLGPLEEIGDMNVMTTFNPKWCVDMSGTNINQVTGPVHTYAKTGADVGLYIYNGLDQDRINYESSPPAPNGLRKIWVQELKQPFNPSNLPCGISIVGITLDPATARNFVGQTHTVTATLKNLLGNPQPNIAVTFSVNSGPNSGVNGSSTTDSNGQANFTYTGSGGAGTDEIKACFIRAGTQVCSQVVTKDWITLPGKISGMKFNDSNGNGAKEPGDVGLANWTIVLKNSTGSIVKTMTTDLNGHYIFDGLAEGNYTVEEVLRADWKQTFPEAPGLYHVTLEAGESVTDRDFGNVMKVTPTEPAGRPVITNFTPSTSAVIDLIGGPTRTFTINVNQTVDVSWQMDGREVFSQTNVNTSSYSNISAAPGIWNISALAQNADGSDLQTWIWNVTQHIQGNGSISGMKFNDSNGNGAKDPGESGLSNWTIVLKNCTGSVVNTMMTDIYGTYTFGGLAAGNYAVEEVLQADWTQTFPSTRIYNLTLAAQENVTGIDFGDNLIPPQASGVYAEREIEKESLSQGESTNITIRINSNVIQALALKEVIPAGWNFTRISDDADDFKNGTNEWVWSNVTPGITKTVIYAITAPTNAIIGTYYINGTIRNSDGIIAVVVGNNIITLEPMHELDILAYYRGLGSDPDRVETADLLKAMDDRRSKTVPAGFANPITNQELSALINEWVMT